MSSSSSKIIKRLLLDYNQNEVKENSNDTLKNKSQYKSSKNIEKVAVKHLNINNFFMMSSFIGRSIDVKKTNIIKNIYKLKEKNDISISIHENQAEENREKYKKKILLYISKLDPNIQTLIKDLLIDTTRRNPAEIIFIKKYLAKTSLLESLLAFNEKNTHDKNNKNRILINMIIKNISINMKYRFIYAGKTLYQIGSKPDNYYFIIEGRIYILKPEKIMLQMTGFEYFTYIMRLKRDNEKYLIDLILRNQEKLIILKEDLNILNYIFFVILFKDCFLSNSISNFKINPRYYILQTGISDKENYIELLKKIINNCFCSPDIVLSDINFNQNFFKTKLTVKKLEKLIFKNIPKISQNLIRRYSAIALGKDQYNLQIFRYKTAKELKKGSFFGETTIKNPKFRNHTVKAAEDCHLGFISLELYESLLKEHKERLNKLMQDFLYDHFIFEYINKEEFNEEYFPCFKFEIKKLGDFLFKQNDDIDYIYFIRYGNVQLNCVYTIKDFIFEVLYKLKDHSLFQKDYKFNEYIDELNLIINDRELKLNLNEYFYTTLLIEITKSIIGLESCLLEFKKYPYSAIVRTQEITYFKISYKDLHKMTQSYYVVKKSAEKCSKQKFKIFVERFIEVIKNQIECNSRKLIDYENILPIEAENNAKLQTSKVITLDSENNPEMSTIFQELNEKQQSPSNENKLGIKNFPLEKKRYTWSNAKYLNKYNFKNSKLKHKSTKQSFQEVSLKSELYLVDYIQKSINKGLIFAKLKEDKFKNINKNPVKIKQFKPNSSIINNNSNSFQNNSSNFSEDEKETNKFLQNNLPLINNNNSRNLNTIVGCSYKNNISLMNNKLIDKKISSFDENVGSSIAESPRMVESNKFKNKKSNLLYFGFYKNIRNNSELPNLTNNYTVRAPTKSLKPLTKKQIKYRLLKKQINKKEYWDWE